MAAVSQDMYTLVIGNKNYSSWSTRAWVTLREAGIAFDEPYASA